MEEKTYRTKREIIGSFAKWIVRQYCYLDELDKLLIPSLREIEKCLNSWEDSKHEVLAILDMGDFVRSIISSCPTIQSFNLNKQERENGATESRIPYVFTDRYTEIKPEYDFIDLGALENNVTRELSAIED